MSADYTQALKNINHLHGYQAPVRALEIIDTQRKALQAVKTWADQRCPCENEQPNPCPLCGADANKPDDVCLSAEKTMPGHILADINMALGIPK